MEIDGYKNYLIYEDGRVYTNNKRKGFLKPKKNENGYLRVGLYKNNKIKYFSIHRLVALAYISNPENKPEVDHKNRIITDNRVENLRWATHLENMQNKGMMKNNTSGEKNIKKTKWDTYIFRKTTNGKRFNKNFKTKAEAIIFRDNYLSNL